MFSLDQTQNQSAEKKNHAKSSFGLSTASRQIIISCVHCFPSLLPSQTKSLDWSLQVISI